MQKKKVIIIGGGVSGLLCAYAFRKYNDVETLILEPGTLGGEFLTGGLKYIHKTDAMMSMFTELGLAFSDYMVKGGIYLKETVMPYPKVFADMKPEEAMRIQADHYRKTRRTEPGDDAKKAMNDPAAVKPRAALRTQFEEMVRMLAKSAEKHGAILDDGVNALGDFMAFTKRGRAMQYDYLVSTIPLWVMMRLAPWPTPHGLAMNLNVIDVVPARDSYSRWDYVYMPYTPAGAIHRISPNEEGYSVEVNGELDDVKLAADLNFIFKGGWHIRKIQKGLKGHLLPLEESIEWPENVAPLGRFAKWDSRATMDVTLEDAYRLGEKWFE
jgi:hypothetical protein